MERQLETMATAQEAPFVYSDFDLIDRSGAVTRRRALAGMKAQWMRPFIGGHLHPYPSTVMMKRSVFLEEGGFDSGFVENTHEDVDLWVRLHQRIPFVFLPEALVQYREEVAGSFLGSSRTTMPGSNPLPAFVTLYKMGENVVLRRQALGEATTNANHYYVEHETPGGQCVRGGFQPEHLRVHGLW